MIGKQRRLTGSVVMGAGGRDHFGGLAGLHPRPQVMILHPVDDNQSPDVDKSNGSHVVIPIVQT